MKRYAHRGIHNDERDENTLNAFERAMQIMNGFECDVRLSRDGVAVIVHDATLCRTHDTDRRVHDTTADELSRMGVPTLEDVLRMLRRGKQIILDLKVAPSHLITQTIAICKKLKKSPSNVVFLVWTPLSRKRHGVCVLRAVDFVFRHHSHVDGIACKYDGSEASIRCIDNALASGMMVNLWSPDKRSIPDMIARYGKLCTMTV